MTAAPETIPSAPRVLVVDDEPDVLELLMVALTSLRQYEVVLADSAAAALREIATSREAFDVFLLDIQMPKMGGVELLGEIRRLPDYADTPVIMLTAMSDREYVDAAFRNGAHDYVTKPFDYDDLLDRIDAVHEPRRKAKVADVAPAPAAGVANIAAAAPQPAASAAEIEAFSNIDRLIGRVEFNNYIAQLSHGRLFSSQLLGVKLSTPAARHRRRDARAAVDPAILLARSISQATNAKGNLFCHFGADAFVVLAHEAGGRPCAFTEDALNRLLDAELDKAAMSSEYKAMLGEPVSTRNLTDEDIPTALHEAVENAERRGRAVTERAMLRVVDDQARAAPRPAAEPNLYEKVLWELFEDKSYLHKPR
jgi:DNA-binding response OmpR family regulator